MEENSDAEFNDAMMEMYFEDTLDCLDIETKNLASDEIRLKSFLHQLNEAKRERDMLKKSIEQLQEQLDNELGCN